MYMAGYIKYTLIITRHVVQDCLVIHTVLIVY
jgi:hypothetical protein